MEQGAREAIFQRFLEYVEHGGEPVDVRECTAIASAFGVHDPEEFAMEQLREATLIYIGACWGVGPKARWRDRLRAWWECR